MFQRHISQIKMNVFQKHIGGYYQFLIRIGSEYSSIISHSFYGSSLFYLKILRQVINQTKFTQLLYILSTIIFVFKHNFIFYCKSKVFNLKKGRLSTL